MQSSSEPPRSAWLPGEWAPKELLGHRLGYYSLYRAQHTATGVHAHLRVLSPDASSRARNRFLAELELASAHPTHFLSPLSLRSDGEALVAACEIPRAKLKAEQIGDVLVVARICQHIAEALQVIHEAGWVHGALCFDAVELIDADRGRVRLLDIGMGLELGRSYAGLDQPYLPSSAWGPLTASPEWDVYLLGMLGQQMAAQVECRISQGCASAALLALFQECTADLPTQRPESISIVWARLREIIRSYPSSDRQEREQASVPSGASLSNSEAAWFVEDRLTGAEAASIEGYASETQSPALRYAAIMTSVIAGSLLALVVAALIAGVAFAR